ncbi:hypothetical protein BpHYR1_040791 [Brachionus plicatilis]|uniref:Uncharacterized protein n=1 Tax=Brachionus plicatilis TaxID=10195 RepID=A0A3M7SWC3_BRAPC|nr:hypothetical protein BpHYR1_040791 [Brachionus plicatilis]
MVDSRTNNNFHGGDMLRSNDFRSAIKQQFITASYDGIVSLKKMITFCLKIYADKHLSQIFPKYY